MIRSGSQRGPICWVLSHGIVLMSTKGDCGFSTRVGVMSGQDQVYLRVLRGPSQGKVFVLKNLTVFEIGRGSACQVRLEDAAVANSHARIYRKSGSWVFFDLNSERGGRAQARFLWAKVLLNQAIARRAGTAIDTIVPPEIERALRAYGYVGDDPDEDPDEDMDAER